MGFVVLAGLFEPGTAVSLFPAPAGALRPGGEGPTGRRLADAAGSVGFDGLAPGDRFFARGFDPYGRQVELSCRALGERDGNEISQSPVRPSSQTVGTQESPLKQDPVGRPDAILHTGIPDGVPLGVALAA